MLFRTNIPPELGAGTTTINGGLVRNRGMEFDFGWKDHIGDFNYSINANLTYNWNKVLKWTGREEDNPASGTNFRVRTAKEEGYPLHYILGFVYGGIAEEIIYAKDREGKFLVDDKGEKIILFYPDDPIFQDTNYDGKITDNDMT